MRATAVVWVLGEGSPPAQRMHRQACDGGAPPFPARRDRPPASHAPSPSCLHAPEQRPRVSCPLVLACRRRMRPAVELAAKVAAKCYAPGEFVPIGALYFLHNGTALWAAKVKRAGSSWGADILLSSSSLRLQFPARCMTYVWLYLVTEPMLRRVLESGRYPEMARLLHQTEVRWLVRRGLVRLAEERCLAEGRSFYGRSQPLFAQQDAASRQRFLVRLALETKPAEQIPAVGGEKRRELQLQLRSRSEQRMVLARSAALNAGVTSHKDYPSTEPLDDLAQDMRALKAEMRAIREGLSTVATSSVSASSVTASGTPVTGAPRASEMEQLRQEVRVLTEGVSELLARVAPTGAGGGWSGLRQTPAQPLPRPSNATIRNELEV